MRAIPLSLEDIESYLSYDSSTGVIRWVRPPYKHQDLAGTEAGTLETTGYRGLRVLGHRGVSWHEPTSRWRAFICEDRRNKNLGSFKSKGLAIEAYENACFKMRGVPCA